MQRQTFNFKKISSLPKNLLGTDNQGLGALWADFLTLLGPRASLFLKQLRISLTWNKLFYESCWRKKKITSRLLMLIRSQTPSTTSLLISSRFSTMLINWLRTLKSFLCWEKTSSRAQSSSSQTCRCLSCCATCCSVSWNVPIWKEFVFAMGWFSVRTWLVPLS